MKKTWKILIVLALAIAVIAVITSKRTPAGGSCTCATTGSPTISASSTTPQSKSVTELNATRLQPEAATVPTSTRTQAKATAGLPPAPPPTKAAVKTYLAKLIDCGSKTCIPCKMMAPILDELREANAGTLPVIFYDVSEQQDKAQEYSIRVIPTQIFYDKEGKEFFRHEGFMPKADIIAKFKEKGIIVKGEK